MHIYRRSHTAANQPQYLIELKQLLLILTCIHTYIYTYYTHTQNTYIHTYIHPSIHTSIHTYIHTCKHTHKRTNIYKCTYIHISDLSGLETQLKAPAVARVVHVLELAKSSYLESFRQLANEIETRTNVSDLRASDSLRPVL